MLIDGNNQIINSLDSTPKFTKKINTEDVPTLTENNNKKEIKQKENIEKQLNRIEKKFIKKVKYSANILKQHGINNESGKIITSFFTLEKTEDISFIELTNIDGLIELEIAVNDKLGNKVINITCMRTDEFIDWMIDKENKRYTINKTKNSTSISIATIDQNGRIVNNGNAIKSVTNITQQKNILQFMEDNLNTYFYTPTNKSEKRFLSKKENNN